MKCLNLTPTISPAFWEGNPFRQSNETFHISLPAEASDCLLPLMEKGQALSPDDIHSLADAVAPIVSQRVKNGRGFAVVKLPWDDRMTVEALAAATSALVASVAKVVLQDAAGTRIVHVRDSGRRLEDGARYHESNAAGSLHTDGPQLVTPPGLLFMACFNRAEHGGDCLLASAVTLHYHLARTNAELLNILHADFHFDRRGFGNGDEPTLKKPVFCCSSQLSFRYLYEYIADGHTRANMPLSVAQREALNALQALLVRKDIVLQFSLNPGEVLIVNNERVCHGRTSFQDGSTGSIRHLIRLWANM